MSPIIMYLAVIGTTITVIIDLLIFYMSKKRKEANRKMLNKNKKDNRPVFEEFNDEPDKATEPTRTLIRTISEEMDEPHDIPGEIQTLIQTYKGDLSKVQAYIISHWNKTDIFDAGFQICLILVNDRLAKENALADILEDILQGRHDVPFDPRDEPDLIRLIKKIRPQAQTPPPSASVDTPGQLKKTEGPARGYQKRTEDERLSDVRAFLDEGGEP